MRPRFLAAFWIAVLCVIGGFYYATYIPDLSPLKAAELISRAPEFNRYARMVKVESVFHFKDSMDTVSSGTFTFRYLNAPIETPAIKANADFRYWGGVWHLNQFDYGCPSSNDPWHHRNPGCQIVNVANDLGHD